MTTKIRDEQYEEEPGYYCPIHSEILKDKPGACSRCGMSLSKDTTDDDWKGKPE